MHPAVAGNSGLQVGLDRRLPDTLPVGSSSAVLCAGTCFHPDADIESVSIVIDGVRHRPGAQRMPRPDQAARFGPLAYRTGFWGIVPVRSGDEPGMLEFDVEVQLADGRTAGAALGAIAIVERLEPLVVPPPAPDTDLIAICMTTFNPDLELFRIQVETIRGQTDQDWVCLISDDASDPDRFEAITEMVAGDERFRISRSERNLGFYRNFERVLAMAPREAGLIALSDHDDRWYPDKLEGLRAALGDAVLAYSDARRVNAEGEVRVATLWRGRRENHSNLTSLLIANTIPGAACLFRRGAIERALPFPEGPGWNFHDHWLALVALAMGEVSYVDRPLYDYVQHKGAVIGRIATSEEPGRPARMGAKSRFGRWRSAYFTGYLHTNLYANVLLGRCRNDLAPRKRRGLELMISASRSPLAFLWLCARPLRALAGRNETLGTERILLRGILWRRWLGLRARVRRRPGGFADELSVPSFKRHNLGLRLRRWIARTDQRGAGDP